MLEDGGKGMWIYILECENGSYYTGIARNLRKRYRAHVCGPGGAKYTRSFKPVKIARSWRISASAGMAMKVERFLKAGGRTLKESLIENPWMLKDMVRERLDLHVEIIPDVEDEGR